MSQPSEGFFTDYLSVSEVNFTTDIAKELIQVIWAEKLLQDNKISHSLQIQPDSQRNYSEFNEVKSALFEVRFAYALHTKQLIAEYEANTGIGNTTVDFKVKSNGNTWLIELTSLRESTAVKSATSNDKDNFTQYISISDEKTNSPEVLDLIKLQNAIYGKVTKEINNKYTPIKFPKIADNTYHTIIVDARSFNAGIFDYHDFFIVVNGSHRLRNIDEGFLCRNFIDKKGNSSHILGVFEENNNNERSKITRESIHFICFVVEKEYKKSGLLEKMIVFANPKYFLDAEEAKKIWLFNTK
ncbi:MAG: hypothetical protein Q8M40_12235 [Legionella sp.]|nr:hypothetical protein [Legionella sp.]